MECAMGKVVRRLTIFLGGFSLMLIVGLTSIVIFGEYSLAVMDWNQDGATTPIEIVESIDIGVREVSVDDRACKEYFAKKDGLEVKIVCDAPSVNE